MFLKKTTDNFKKFAINPSIKIIGEHIEKRNFNSYPILIVASPRSGTTLLLSILGAHPNIHAISHQTFAFDKWRPANGKPYNHTPYRIDRLYRHLIFRTIKKTANRWCEKTPKHVRWIPYIADFYQNRLKIIHIIRDGRDVVVSKHPKDKSGAYWVPIERWVEYVQKGLQYKDKSYLYTLFYEDLVSDYTHEIKKVLDFLEEPFTKEMQDWTNETTIQDSKHLRKRIRKANTNAIGKWKNPQHALRIKDFFRNKQAVELLYELGYQ